MVDYGDSQLPQRFWDKIQIVAEASTYPGPCWIWTGESNGTGYGRVRFSDGVRNRMPHRVVYGELVGAIPDPLQLDHLCRITLCCNPDHVEPVTTRVNVLRGVGITSQNAKKDECSNGHPYDDQNTYLRPGGGRSCKACKRALRLDWGSRNRDRVNQRKRELYAARRQDGA